MKDLGFEPVYGLEANIPDILDKKSPVYDDKRVHITDDYFYLVENKDVYMRGKLQLKQIDFDQTFNLILWVKVSARSFVEMSESIDSSKKEYTIKAQLVSDISFYSNALISEVLLSFDTKGKVKLPYIILLNDESELYYDYRNGISKDKYLKWQKKLEAF